jgi:lipoyl(octanoyl) transferase
MKVINNTNKIVKFQEVFSRMLDMVSGVKNSTNDETLWLLQHNDVFTIGKSGTATDIIDKTIDYVETDRGGQMTYHGTGQMIAYSILDVKKHFNSDVRKYVTFLQKTIVDSLGYFGIEAFGDTDLIGVWVEKNGVKKKIASMGIRISGGISYHGAAVNISPDLENFKKIIPCGISDFGVTSCLDLGFDVDIEKFAEVFIEKFAVNLIQSDKFVSHAAIFNQQRFLYCQKRSALRKHFPSTWELCGGSSEDGESAKQSLDREIPEEINISKWQNFGVIYFTECWVDGVKKVYIVFGLKITDWRGFKLEDGKAVDHNFINVDEINILSENTVAFNAAKTAFEICHDLMLNSDR